MGCGSSISDTRYAMGTPKLRFCPPRRIAVAMPTTSPRSLNSGPPDEPGAMGAEICSTSSDSSTWRTALMSPSDTVSDKPRG